ncbi:hypothetical protein ABZ793_00280 [Micromonospora sp. NPDC047465]|uniref:hypothetical protein n=1 Tax=Micromonospora sp. NPDC047465 TaxID=3154813 RepID=UPI0033FA52DC
MNRPLTAGLLGAVLLLAACADEKPAASRPTPDGASRAGCAHVETQVKDQNLFWSMNRFAGMRASGSVDPGVSAAGRELMEAAQEARDLDLGSQGKADMTQAEARIAEAQQKLMTACRELLGEPPWMQPPASATPR